MPDAVRAGVEDGTVMNNDFITCGLRLVRQRRSSWAWPFALIYPCRPGGRGRPERSRVGPGGPSRGWFGRLALWVPSCGRDRGEGLGLGGRGRWRGGIVRWGRKTGGLWLGFRLGFSGAGVGYPGTEGTVGAGDWIGSGRVRGWAWVGGARVPGGLGGGAEGNLGYVGGLGTGALPGVAEVGGPRAENRG